MKGKTIHAQATGFQEVEPSRKSAALRTGRLYPGTYFFLDVESTPQVTLRSEGLYRIMENRPPDLPASSSVPQPNAPPLVENKALKNVTGICDLTFTSKLRAD
jgi:hypothetical protein